MVVCNMLFITQYYLNYGVTFDTTETIESINPKIKQAIGKLYPGVQEIDWSQPAN